jgi:hypothetical protein
MNIDTFKRVGNEGVQRRCTGGLAGGWFAPGMEIVNARTTSACTAAWKWKTRAEAKYYFLTAGHCGQRHDNWLATVQWGINNFGSAVLDNFGAKETVPLCKHVTTTCFFKIYTGDLAWISVSNDIMVSAAWVFSGGRNSNTHRLVEGSHPGKWTGQERDKNNNKLEFCFSGRTTGESCRFKIRKVGADVRYDDGTRVRNVIISYGKQACPKFGDSGSPVYTFGSWGVRAAGVLSGSQAPSFFNDYECKMYFTDINEARDLAKVGDVVASKKP